MASGGRSKSTRGRSGGSQSAAAKARTPAKPPTEDEEAKLVVDGVAYKLSEMELGELEELEEHTGLPMDAISYGSARVIAFVVYLVRRRGDPDYTLDDARKIQISSIDQSGASEGVAAKVGDSTPSEGGD